MSNQVLALHRVSPRCYDLTGLRTGSVRDQLLRSTLIVNSLCAEGAIGVGFPLLVFGAGAAGMNAAMLAAARHVDVTVVELTTMLALGPEVQGLLYDASSRIQLHDTWISS